VTATGGGCRDALRGESAHRADEGDSEGMAGDVAVAVMMPWWRAGLPPRADAIVGAKEVRRVGAGKAPVGEVLAERAAACDGGWKSRRREGAKVEKSAWKPVPVKKTVVSL